MDSDYPLVDSVINGSLHLANKSTDFDYANTLDYTLNKIVWWYILCASTFGLILNSYCIATLVKLNKNFALRHLALFIIASSDICALVLILIAHLRLFRWMTNYYAGHIFCKLHTFLLHTFSAYSTWCWVLLSSIRYLAVFYPYKHMLFQLVSLKYSLSFTFLLSMGVEGWTLVFVTHENATCTINLHMMTRTNFKYLTVMDVVMTYAAPLICIIFVNAAIYGKLHVCRKKKSGLISVRADSLVKPYSSIVSEPDSHFAAVMSVNREKRIRQQKFHFLIRLTLLVLINLVLNLPNYIVRLLNTVYHEGDWLPYPYNSFVQLVSFALSYTHYCINCVYIRFIVNGRMVRKRCPSDEFSTGFRLIESAC